MCCGACRAPFLLCNTGRWAAEQGPGGKAALLDEVVRCYQSGALQPPAVREFPLADWRQALQYYRQDYREAKVLLLPSA